MGTASVKPDCATRLSSPAVLQFRHVPGAPQLLFAGDVIDRAGSPVDDAVVTVWGIELATEMCGGFELLTYGPQSDAAPIPVTVTAPNHRPLTTSMVIDKHTGRLDDGTLALVRTFILESGDA